MLFQSALTACWETGCIWCSCTWEACKSLLSMFVLTKEMHRQCEGKAIMCMPMLSPVLRLRKDVHQFHGHFGSHSEFEINLTTQRNSFIEKKRKEGRKERKNDRNKEVEKGRNNCLPKPRIKNMLIFIYDKLGKDEIPAMKWWRGKNNFYFTEISKNVHVFSKVRTWNLARKKQMKTFIEDLMI